MQPLSASIRKFMEYKRISQAELGRRLGLTRSAIGKFFRKDWNPSIDTLDKICKVLDLKLTLKLSEV